LKAIGGRVIAIWKQESMCMQVYIQYQLLRPLVRSNEVCALRSNETNLKKTLAS